MRRIRDGLTFSNVVSVLALLFALGLGGAWAATELSKNEVKSKHIGKGQVKSKDLGKNAVSSPKIADDSVTGADVAESDLGQVQSAALADNAAIANFATNALSAGNSGTLDGQDSSAFAASDRFRVGSGNSGAASPQSLFSAGGVEVLTDGDLDSDATVRLSNTTGGPIRIVDEFSLATQVLNDNAAAAIPFASGANVGTLTIVRNDDPARAMALTCGEVDLASGNRLNCWAVLSASF